MNIGLTRVRVDEIKGFGSTYAPAHHDVGKLLLHHKWPQDLLLVSGKATQAFADELDRQGPRRLARRLWALPLENLVGYHDAIARELDIHFRVLGGCQHVVDGKTIYLVGSSATYGPVHAGLVQRCFEPLGFTVVPDASCANESIMAYLEWRRNG